MKKIFALSLFAVSMSLPSALQAQVVADSIPDSEELEEVVVVGSRPVIKSTAEKTTYEAAEDPEAQTLTVLDMLKKVPGVTVDGQDNITLNGSSNFAVHVDGRPVPAFSQNPGKMLKAVPASVVQRIEVINAPGAEYDAEGVGGIINLAMKGTQAGQQNLDGFSTTLTLEGGTNNVGGNLYSMLQKGRVGLTFSLNGTHGQMPWMDIDMDRSQADGFRSLFQGRMRNKFDFVNSSLDLSLKLSGADRLTLSGSYTYTNFKNPYHADYFSYMNGAPLTTYHMDRGSSVKNHSVTAGAEYVHTFREDYRHRLKLAYQFSAQPAKVDSYVHYSPLEETVGSIPESYDSWGRTNMPEHIIQADYGQPIGEKHLVNMGGKMTWRRGTSDAIGLDYIHDTSIAAGYATYGFTGGIWNFKAGLRYEHTAQKARFREGTGTDFSANFSNFVPNASVGMELGGMSNVSLGYNMRISRPGIDYLNPDVDWDNPLNIIEGNPYLTPEKHHNIALNYSGMLGKVMLNSRLTYTFCNDGLTPISSLKNGVEYTTYANALHSRRVSLQLSGSWKICSKSMLIANVVPSFQSMHAQVLGNHGWTLSVFAGLQQELPWKLKLGVNIFANTPMVDLQGRGMSQFMHMLSLARSFLKDDRLSVSVQALNPFYARVNIKKSTYGPGYSSLISGHMNMRLVQVSVSWRIGNLNSKTATRDMLDSDAVGAPSTNPGGGVQTPGTGM